VNKLDSYHWSHNCLLTYTDNSDDP